MKRRLCKLGGLHGRVLAASSATAVANLRFSTDLPPPRVIPPFMSLPSLTAIQGALYRSSSYSEVRNAPRRLVLLPRQGSPCPSSPEAKASQRSTRAKANGREVLTYWLAQKRHVVDPSSLNLRLTSRFRPVFGRFCCQVVPKFFSRRILNWGPEQWNSTNQGRFGSRRLTTQGFQVPSTDGPCQ
jgi:hypothetical protein